MRNRLKKINVAGLFFLAFPIGSLFWSVTATAAITIVDARDTLDRAVTGPDLIGGVDDPSFDVYVADHELFDSNVYRIPSDADVRAIVGPAAVKQDHINSPTAGIDGQWVFGRQIIDLALRADDNRYAQNTDLNNVSTNDKAAWNWGLGSGLSGQVGVDYLRALVSFVNSFDYVRNTYSRIESFAAARYQIGPRWAIFGGVLSDEITLSDPSSRVNDLRHKSVDMGLDFATSVENSIGLDYRYTDARYPNAIDLSNTTFDPDYREDRVRFLVKRLLSEKTTLDLNAGYLRRDYSNAIIGSFSGPIWRGTLGWQPTDKTQLIVSEWRELQAYLTDATNYYRGTGASISPVWIASEKITLAIVVSREDQSFIGSSPNALNETARRDTVNAQQGSLTYTPSRALTFDVSYRYEQRSSNQELRTYNDGLASAGVRFQFQ